MSSTKSKMSTAKVIAVTRITNPNAPDFDHKHNAFTGLGEFNGRYYLAFRQGDAHATDYKQPVTQEIYVSADAGKSWTPLQSYSEPAKGSWYYDYRNSHFCSHNGTLRLYSFASWVKGKNRKHISQVQELGANGKFSAPKILNLTGVIWAPVSHGGKVYAAAMEDGETFLWESDDGINFVRRARIEVGTEECSVFPDKNGVLQFVLRREIGERKINSLSLAARAPYDWVQITQSLKECLDCPIAFACGDERYVAVRHCHDPQPVKIFKMAADGSLAEVLTLPGGGDSTYCGVAPLTGRRFLVSYYSQHENAPGDQRAAGVYVAEIEL